MYIYRHGCAKIQVMHMHHMTSVTEQALRQRTCLCQEFEFELPSWELDAAVHNARWPRDATILKRVQGT